MNHQGTPLSIGTICVSGADQRFEAGGDVRQSRCLDGEDDDVVDAQFRGYAEVATATQRRSPPSVIHRPSLSIAAWVSPRATIDTSCPASASLAAIQPPMAPAPTTQMFMVAPMG